MRIVKVGRDYRIFLSKRNLLALLTKLEWPESRRTIIAGDTTKDWNPYHVTVSVTAEPDDVHYADRLSPGEMHPRTEEDIKNA